MDEQAQHLSAQAQPRVNTPVPTAGRVLTRTVPAAVVLVAGFPLLAWWWSLDEDSTPWASVAVLFGIFLLGWGVHRITRAPRPRLGKNVDREPLQRAITNTAENGVLPAESPQRSAVGALACEPVESTLLRAATVVGLSLTFFVTQNIAWMVPAALFAVNAVSGLPRALRGRRYLKELHAQLRTS